jgi:membrane protease subunit (stomatin/prohibitin family)
MRAAVVGGTAYYAGKKVQQSREREAQQEAQIAELQTPPAQAQAQAAGPPPPSTEDRMGQLRQLKELLDQGVLTQAEFDLEKQKILQSM